MRHSVERAVNSQNFARPVEAKQKIEGWWCEVGRMA